MCCLSVVHLLSPAIMLQVLMTLTSVTVVKNQAFPSYITVHTDLSYGFPSQPLLGTSTRLNCSVTLHPPSLNISVFTIQYQWSSNSTARGNESELVLPSLSPADATTYNCNVTVASVFQGHVISNLSTYVLTARFKAPYLAHGVRRVYYVGEKANITCHSRVTWVTGTMFTWRVVDLDMNQQLNLPLSVVSKNVFDLSILTNRSFALDITCAVTIPGYSNIISGKTAVLLNVEVPALSVLLSSSANTVLDIDGYNSFFVQCGGKFRPNYMQSEESFSFILTNNNIPVANISSPVSTTEETVTQNISVQQHAPTGPTTLVYNCTVAFRISRSLIATSSNTTQVIVKGPSLPAAPVLGPPPVATSATKSVLIQWTIPEVTYSPEKYTVYYIINNEGRPISTDEHFNKSDSVYGLNHTGFSNIRDQHYNNTLNNLIEYTVYYYKVVATNTEGKNESNLNLFRTFSQQESIMGPPQNFTIVSTNSTLNLSWSHPVIRFSQFANIVIVYNAFCSNNYIERRTFRTSIVITAGIKPGRSYSCFVRALTHISTTSTTTVSVVTDDIIPGPPAEFMGISNTSRSITFTFKPPQKPNGVYSLQCCSAIIDDKKAHMLSLNGTQSRITLTGLLPYTNYSCNITAHNIFGEGKAATINVVTMQDVPSGPPQFLSFSNITSHTIKVFWSPPAPSQRNGDIINYLVICSLDGSFINSTRTNSTSLTITGLQPFTNYTCSVRAATIKGDGPAVVKFVVTLPSGPPQNLNISATMHTITLMWSPPRLSNGVISNYIVLCLFNHNVINRTVTTSTKLTIVGLKQFTNYTCSVRAATLFGTGPPIVKSIVTDKGAPAAPVLGQSPVATSATTSALIQWTVPEVTHSPEQYTVYYIINNERFPTSVRDEQFSKSDTVYGLNHTGFSNIRDQHYNITLNDLNEYTVYYYKVVATNTEGKNESNLNFFRTFSQQESIMGPPQNFFIITTNHSLSLFWSRPVIRFPQFNDISIVYSAFCACSNNFSERLTSNTTIEITARIEPGRTYSCHVRALTHISSSFTTTISVVAKKKIPSPPAAPVLVLPPVTTSSSALIQWTVPEVTYSSEQYTVYYTPYNNTCAASDEFYNEHVTVDGLNHNKLFTIRDQHYNIRLNNLSLYTVYCYKVVANNSEGRNESIPNEFQTKIPKGVTGPPQNFAIITRSRFLNLSWSRPVINFPRFNEIFITYLAYCNIGDLHKIVKTNDTSIQITDGILPGQHYTCNVSAVSDIGSVSYTEEISGITSQDVPPIVVAVRTNVMVVRGSNAVIQFSIKAADPSVQVKNISWNFITSSGMSSMITNTSTTLLSIDRLTLTIIKARLNNTGVYTIMVSNIAGNHSESVNLDILVPAQLLYAKGIAMTRTTGESVTFNCTADGIPRPQISWRRQGQFLNTEQLQRYSVITTISSGFRSSELPGVEQIESKLTISNLRETDEGIYSCIAQSATTPPAALSESFDLNVEIPPPINYCENSPCENGGTCMSLSDKFSCHCSESYTGSTCNIVVRTTFKPEITTQPQNTTNRLFSTVRLTCIAEGYPEPEIRWYKDGTRITSLESSTSTSLVIEELRPNNRGFYYCEAVNSVGTARSHTVLVNIKGVVQYEAFILQNETMIGTDDLLQKINNALSGSKLAINASFFFIEKLNIKTNEASGIPIIITLITDDGGSEQLRQEVLLEMDKVEKQLGLQISINVTEVDRFDGCGATTTTIPSISENRTDLTISITWPETDLGDIAVVTCPCGNLNITAQVGSRYCGGTFTNGAEWSMPHIAPCNLSDNARRICQLSQLKTEERLDRLEVFTNSSNQIKSDEVSASVTVLVASTADVSGNKTLSEEFLSIVDNIIRAEPEVLQESQIDANSSAKLLDAFERVSEGIPIPENKTSAIVTQATFAIAVQKVDPMTFSGLNFSAVSSGFTDQSINKSGLLFNMMSSVRSTGSMSLPRNLLQKANGTRVTLSVFITNSLFLRRENNNTEIASIILAAGVVGIRKVENLNPPIVATFRKNPNINGSDPMCSFWDQALDDGYGGWSTVGCVTINSSSSSNDTNMEVTCMCDHLTNFAILLDVSPDFGSITISDRPEDYFLEAVSYIGVVLSIVSLLLTIISYVGTKKLRFSDHGQLLLNLCFSLLGLYIMFIFSVHSSSVPPLCAMVSIMLHYFMLVVFMVMAAEAVNLYLKLVVVLGHTISHYVFKATIICWVFPVFVVMFCFAPSPKSYMHPNVCRAHGISFYIGLIVPFVVIYVFNWVVYSIILFTLICKNYQKDDQDKIKARVTTKQQLVAAVTLSVLFGLGWGIGLAATEGINVSAVRDIFSALFIICTAFQGVMVFCLQTLRSKDIRMTWARWFQKATGKDVSRFTSTAGVSQIWRNRRSANRKTSTQQDSFTFKSNDYEMATLQRSVIEKTLPSEIITSIIEDADENKSTGEPHSPVLPKDAAMTSELPVTMSAKKDEPEDADSPRSANSDLKDLPVEQDDPMDARPTEGLKAGSNVQHDAEPEKHLITKDQQDEVKQAEKDEQVDVNSLKSSTSEQQDKVEKDEPGGLKSGKDDQHDKVKHVEKNDPTDAGPEKSLITKDEVKQAEKDEQLQVDANSLKSSTSEQQDKVEKDEPGGLKSGKDDQHDKVKHAEKDDPNPADLSPKSSDHQHDEEKHTGKDNTRSDSPKPQLVGDIQDKESAQATAETQIGEQREETTEETSQLRPDQEVIAEVPKAEECIASSEADLASSVNQNVS